MSKSLQKSKNVTPAEQEFIQELIRGNVALWATDEFDFSSLSNSSYVKMDWTAVWVDGVDPRWTTSLGMYRESISHPQSVNPVHGRLLNTLGSNHSFAMFTPVFYLQNNSLSDREQRRAWDEKVDEISKLKNGFLCLVGFSQPASAVELIINEFPHNDTSTKFVFVGCDSEFASNLAQLIPANDRGLLARILVLESNLVDLTNEAIKEQESEIYSPTTIRVGGEQFNLGSLLQRENPIDLSFHIILLKDLEQNNVEVSDREVLEDFISGINSPWLAYKRRIIWSRFNSGLDQSLSEDPVTKVIELLQYETANKSPSVSTFTIPAEQGSGLTTVLHSIAYQSAVLGYPTMIYRGEVDHYDYDTLRTFLESIQRTKKGLVPALIVIDETISASLSLGITELPSRLASDGRPVVIVRGIRINSPARYDSNFRDIRKLPKSVSKNINEVWAPDELRESLSEAELATLIAWVDRYWGEKRDEFERYSQAISDWDKLHAEAGIDTPFLICLYIILKEKFTTPSHLGRFLVKKMTDEFNSLVENSNLGANGKALSDCQLKTAVELLQDSFSKRIDEGNSLNVFPPAPDIYSHVFILLCMFSALKIYPPITVLADAAKTDKKEIVNAIATLSAQNIAKIFGDSAQEYSSMSARSFHYKHSESYGLRHPIFGIMVLNSISLEDVNQHKDFLKDVLEDYKLADHEYPLELLNYVMPSLTPVPENIDFVADLSRKMLRLQQVAGSDYHMWVNQSNLRSLKLLDVLDRIPNVIANQNASILHSKGLTRYKSLRWRQDELEASAITEIRNKYEKASGELFLASKRITEDGDRTDDEVSILTTHGMLYNWWSKFERQHGFEDNSNGVVKELRIKAVNFLTKSLGSRTNNSHAAGALADILLDICEQTLTEKIPPLEFASNLATIFEYLQYKPDALFEHMWEESFNRAITLCGSTQSKEVIKWLITNGHDLGRALDALTILHGKIPTEVSEQTTDIEIYTLALDALGEAPIDQTNSSQLANLLRYAVYSALPENADYSKYRVRYELIKNVSKDYVKRHPLFLFDYAMLAFQVGEYQEGNELYKDLRRGRSFLEVPLERSKYLMSPTNPHNRLQVEIVVTNIEGGGSCWGVTIPKNGNTLALHVKFSERDFRTKTGSEVSLQQHINTNINLRSAGPTAMPIA